jgi:hypothetical protein
MTPRNMAAVTRACLAGALVALSLTGCASTRNQVVACRSPHDEYLARYINALQLLEAQAVPSATLIPCVLRLPGGWRYGGWEVRRGLVRFWLDSDRAGVHAVQLTMKRACDHSSGTPAPLANPPPGLTRFDVFSIPHASLSYFVFPGACVTYRFAFTRGSAPSLYHQADHALGFTKRSTYVNGVRVDTGLDLCGAGAPPCPG